MVGRATHIAQQALVWPEILRLMTVPGVNLIGAASFHNAARAVEIALLK